MSTDIISPIQQVLQLHQRRHPGAMKEYAILYELLYRIEAPSRLTGENELTEKLKVETGLKVALRAAGFLLYFYLNDQSGEPFAQMDLSKSTLPGKGLNTSLSDDKIWVILNTTRQFIEEKKGVSTILNDWIRQYFKGKSQPGIARILDSMEVGEERSMEIAIGNDLSKKVEQIFDYLFHAEAVVHKMSLLLNSGATMDISPEEKLFNQAVDDAAYKAFSLDEFIALLNTNYENLLRIRDKEKGHHYKGYHINIYILDGSKVSRSTANLLHQMRSRQDTQRALQRLLLLGIIDDFHEENNVFKIHFIKKEKHEYEDALCAYIARYETSEYVKIWIDRLYRKPVIEEEHPSVLFGEFIEMRKVRDVEVLDYVRILLRFCYARIVPQRAILARKMTEGYDTTDELRFDNSPAFFYDKKYAHPAHQPNLINDTSEGTVKALDIVWKYMDKVSRVKNEFSLLNIRQLQTSTTLMRKQYPDNPVFALLNAFCTFYLETPMQNGEIQVSDKARLKAGADDFVSGFIHFKDLYNMNEEDFRMAVTKFQKKTTQHKIELENIMNQVGELLYLELRNRWLRQFKQKLYG